MRARSARMWLLATLLAAGALAGCERDMADQPRYEANEAAALFANGAVNQPPVPGTVARGERAREATLATRPPMTRALLARGRERFAIHCAPCHGASGRGDGMIVQRGFPAPPSFHQPRLREVPARHLVSVIGAGKGAMFPYASRVAPPDRWAIAAWIRALQLSQHADAARLPADLRRALEAGTPEPES